ncbi:hypothetical protein CPB83DRAFT_261989 [Crepidotus variabilis]|uniref:Uncharacterized protein n=1 Tax=Crepidotus variabilis TaxID=179855 RepID=A0A9P6EHS5_9AGAR|nr:hypothetical protein CPB83DRAFT_261989 [Crepidotus variabilis]
MRTNLPRPPVNSSCSYSQLPPTEVSSPGSDLGVVKMLDEVVEVMNEGDRAGRERVRAIKIFKLRLNIWQKHS